MYGTMTIEYHKSQNNNIKELDMPTLYVHHKDIAITAQYATIKTNTPTHQLYFYSVIIRFQKACGLDMSLARTKTNRSKHRYCGSKVTL